MIETITLDNLLPEVFAGAENQPPVSTSGVWMRQLELRRGRRVLVAAESGTGKSSMCSYIYGARSDYRGRILFDGTDIRTLTPARWCELRRRSLAWLPQEMRLFPELSVIDNILIKNRLTDRYSEPELRAMLARLEIDNKASSLAGHLSVGQQQRVALARIMACQPEVLLLDEPFSAMDVFLKDQLQQELQEMLEDYPGIVILVSHSRDEIYRFCEELVIAGGGKKIIQGRTKDIFTQPVYKEAARLTGCKNFSKIRICNAHTVEASDWGITLHFQNAVPADAGSIGFRAHDFVPVWGNRTGNSIRFHAVERAELPFEYHYYFMPENGREDETHKICWFVQRGELAGLEQRGMPDYLRLPENKIMFLKD